MIIYPEVVTECLGKYEELMLPMSNQDRADDEARLEKQNAEILQYRRKNPNKFPTVHVPIGVDHNEVYWNMVRAARSCGAGCADHAMETAGGPETQRRGSRRTSASRSLSAAASSLAPSW